MANNELVSGRDIFNRGFVDEYQNKQNEGTYFQRLLNYCVKMKQCSEENSSFVIQNYQRELSSAVYKQETKFDHSKDIDLIRQRRFKELISIVDNYLQLLEPYDALQLILNTNLSSLIEDAQVRIKEVKNTLICKIEYLKNTYPLIYNNHSGYRKLIDEIFAFLKNNTRISTDYELLFSSLILLTKNNNLSDISRVLDCLELEDSIVYKFKKEDIVRMLRVLDKPLPEATADFDKFEEAAMQDHGLQNICQSFLINYVYASIYKDDASDLRFSEALLKTVAFEAKLESYTKDDFIEVIKNGPIKFSEDEFKYINTFFINMFQFNSLIELPKIVKN